LDVNDAGDAALDANHGLWIVYRALGGPIPGICRKRVPVFPNQGFPSTRQCDWTRATDFRPGAGHYTFTTNAGQTVTHEVIVYADADDSDQLKSFEWGVTGGAELDEAEIPDDPGHCRNYSSWRPEVVSNNDQTWAFWIGTRGAFLCYSRYVPPAAGVLASWESPKEIPFDGEFSSCGAQDRILYGPPSATVRNGIINLAVRDRDQVNLNPDPWVWMIQLNDTDNDGLFQECEGTTDECPGSCSAECGHRVFWEERSPWVPHTEMSATYAEVGPMATTEHLLMTPSQTDPHEDYTFFYNPTIAAGAGQADLLVRVRQSW